MRAKNRLTVEQRKECILENASIIFAQKGFHGAKTKEIANICGISEAVIYKYFDDKEDLFIKAVFRIHTKMLSDWEKTISECPTGLEAILKLIRVSIMMLYENPAICGNILHSFAFCHKDEKYRKQVANWKNKLQDFWSDLVRRGIMDGSLIETLEPERVGFFLQGSVWMTLFNIISDPSYDHEKCINRVTKAALERIASPAGLAQISMRQTDEVAIGSGLR